MTAIVRVATAVLVTLLALQCASCTLTTGGHSMYVRAQQTRNHNNRNAAASAASANWDPDVTLKVFNERKK